MDEITLNDVVDMQIKKYENATDGVDYCRYNFYLCSKKIHEYVDANQGLHPYYRDHSNLDRMIWWYQQMEKMEHETE